MSFTRLIRRIIYINLRLWKIIAEANIGKIMQSSKTQSLWNPGKEKNDEVIKLGRIGSQNVTPSHTQRAKLFKLIRTKSCLPFLSAANFSLVSFIFSSEAFFSLAFASKTSWFFLIATISCKILLLFFFKKNWPVPASFFFIFVFSIHSWQ